MTVRVMRAGDMVLLPGRMPGWRHAVEARVVAVAHMRRRFLTVGREVWWPVHDMHWDPGRWKWVHRELVEVRP